MGRHAGGLLGWSYCDSTGCSTPTRCNHLAACPSLCFLLTTYPDTGVCTLQVGRLEDAVRSFHLALDLKPSAADVAIIKGAIDKVHLPDEDLDEEV